jgi:hypothetical protein
MDGGTSLVTLAPGIHPDVSKADYHDDPAERPSLTASIAHVLLTSSPKHAWTKHPKLNPDFKRVEEDKFDLGTAAHQLMLEGITAVQVCDFKDWRTNDAKAMRDQARADGLVPMLAAHWTEVQAMVEAAQEQIAALEVDVKPFTNGAPEQTLVWAEPGNVTCRARVDWLHSDLPLIDDYKTTRASADPHSWSRTLFNIGADVQAAFYVRGLSFLQAEQIEPGVFRTREPWPEFRFIVQETFPPYALSVVSLSPAAMMIAEKKVHFALDLWRYCLERDEWPAYPTQIAYAELPPWEEERWLTRELEAAR